MTIIGSSRDALSRLFARAGELDKTAVVKPFKGSIG